MLAFIHFVCLHVVYAWRHEDGEGRAHRLPHWFQRGVNESLEENISTSVHLEVSGCQEKEMQTLTFPMMALNPQSQLICTRTYSTRCPHMWTEKGIHNRLFCSQADSHLQQEASYISHPIKRTGAHESMSVSVCARARVYVCAYVTEHLCVCECPAKWETGKTS